jgi:hypothetical protein
MKTRRIGVLVVLALLSVSLVADAQQPGKIYRIGRLNNFGPLVLSTQSGDPLDRAFEQEAIAEPPLAEQ